MRLYLLCLIGICTLIRTYAFEKFHYVEAPIQTIDLHYRVKPKSSNPSNFGIAWNYIDSLNYCYATLSTLGAAMEDSWGDYIELKIGVISDEQDSLICSETISCNYNLHSQGISILLSAGESGAVLEVGSKEVDHRYEIPFNYSTGNQIKVWSDDYVQILRNDFKHKSFAPAKFANIQSIDALLEYLRSSKDLNEGLWTYFDRNTDPLLAQMGGSYNIATVKNDSGYDIVYISGASVNVQEWQPLRIKGYITPATFPGSFDLTWIEPSGQILNYETSATISGDLIEFRFPHWESSVRFRRIVQQ